MRCLGVAFFGTGPARAGGWGSECLKRPVAIMRIETVLGGDPDVLLREVASVSSQRYTLGQLGAERVEVIGELVERGLELLGVGCLVGELGRDDHLRQGVDDRLAVEALVKRTVRGLHDL